MQDYREAPSVAMNANSRKKAAREEERRKKAAREEERHDPLKAVREANQAAYCRANKLQPNESPFGPPTPTPLRRTCGTSSS